MFMLGLGISVEHSDLLDNPKYGLRNQLVLGGILRRESYVVKSGLDPKGSGKRLRFIETKHGRVPFPVMLTLLQKSMRHFNGSNMAAIMGYDCEVWVDLNTQVSWNSMDAFRSISQAIKVGRKFDPTLGEPVWTEQFSELRIQIGENEFHFFYQMHYGISEWKGSLPGADINKKQLAVYLDTSKSYNLQGF